MTHTTDNQYQWMVEKVKRQRDVKEKQKRMMTLLPSELLLPSATQVDRVSSNELTVEEFYMKYAKTRTPVIITDMAEKMTRGPWTLQHIKNVAGDCSAVLKKPVTDSVEWARLEDAKSVVVKDFIDNVISADGDRDLYLFDWSLPQHCLPLAEELNIPKYFAGDYLQRLSPGSQYRDTWPSLFIAAAGLRSELHVDTFGSNFWMALFQGRKKWILYPAEEQCLLYPQLLQSMDPTFEVDVTKPDLDRFPLLSLTHPVQCILQPGDLLFVPAGCPHHITNLETSVAISANFVDSSNFDCVVEELRINALIDPRAADLVKQMQSSEFKATQDFNIGDLHWNDFKKWPHDKILNQ
ncbi:bifunctional arginine demethylase and lysyl-hydroxylase JMJD6-like isoform X2 [Gigantopelta aegis]|uniref:bifunctional arginine demethylase and lysyl-hydroxylase JMJD6-like isoform X2 n=1 Tax=Gigantopelta aegis TaxID=1735272 RepID=UPI001B888FE0|nr:bifunctional arginine demethylase and lysyl-hydroxylase JMJD6-like isoform X2 [Gigantopelta aegis]